MRKLSTNFTLGEMTHSTALVLYNKEHGTNIKNEPNAMELKNLIRLCELYLQPLRDQYGPIIINSGYRTTEVNRMVGGARNSYHTYGLAADINCSSWEQAFLFASFFIRRWMKDGLPFEEVIVSRRQSTGSIWVHLSIPSISNMRNAKRKVTFLSY